MEPTRRQYLAASAAVGTGMLAGCSQIPFIGGGGGVSTAKNWVPDAGEASNDDETIGFSAYSPSQIHSNKSNLVPSSYQNIREGWSRRRIGVPLKSVNMELSIPNGTVITGSFGKDEVTEELTNSVGSGDSGEYTEEDSEGNFAIYIPDSAEGADSAPKAYAVKGNTIVEAQRYVDGNSVQNPVEVAKTIIDIGTEGNGRAVDASDDFKKLVNNLSGTSISGRTRSEEISGEQASIAAGRFEGVVALGGSSKINGSNTKLKEVFVFDGESDVDKGDIEEYVERNDTNGRQWAMRRNVSVSTSGRVATITGTMSTYDFTL